MHRTSIRSSKMLTQPKRAPRFIRAFTLIELLVSIAIIIILLAVLLPAIARARQQALSSGCKEKLKGITLASFYYQYDWDGSLMPATNGSITWCQGTTVFIGGKSVVIPGMIWSYANVSNKAIVTTPPDPSTKVWACPQQAYEASLQINSNITYCLNGVSASAAFKPCQMSNLQVPDSTFAFMDAGKLTSTSLTDTTLPICPTLPGATLAGSNPYGYFHAWHLEKGNVSWYDGHVTEETPTYVNFQATFAPIGANLNAMQAKWHVGFLTPLGPTYNCTANTNTWNNSHRSDYYMWKKEMTGGNSWPLASFPQTGSP